MVDEESVETRVRVKQGTKLFFCIIITGKTALAEP